MKRKFFIASLGLVVVIAISICYISSNTTERDSLLFANLEALTMAENGDGDYKNCLYGDVTSPASGGVFRLYCGTCWLQRIWPKGDGRCRLY